MLIKVELTSYASSNMNTYVGHNFVVRSAATHKLLEKVCTHVNVHSMVYNSATRLFVDAIRRNST